MRQKVFLNEISLNAALFRLLPSASKQKKEGRGAAKRFDRQASNGGLDQWVCQGIVVQ